MFPFQIRGGISFSAYTPEITFSKPSFWGIQPLVFGGVSSGSQRNMLDMKIPISHVGKVWKMVRFVSKIFWGGGDMGHCSISLWV